MVDVGRMEVECDGCGHSWDYSGKMRDYATCPSCNSSVPIEGSTVSQMVERMEKIEENQRKIQALLKQVLEHEVEEADVEGSGGNSGMKPYDPTEDL